LTSDIRAVEWLPLSAAMDRLTLPHEQAFLRQVGRRAVRRAVQKARARETMLAIAQPPVDQEPPVVLPDAAALPRSRSPSGWNVLAQLIRRLLGQQSSPA
jgi:8-oxo-dGTP diphosphatase